MKTKLIIYSLGITLLAFAAKAEDAAEKHGWIGTETIKTRFGEFEFKGG